MSSPTLRRVAIALVLSAIGFTAPVSGQASRAPEASPVALADLQAEALVNNPGLQALRAAAEASNARIPEAGTLPDPLLQIGAMNLGLPELDAGMPASMLPTVQLSQTLPFFGKRALREGIATSQSEVAHIAIAEAEWRLRADVAGRYHALLGLDGRLAVHRRTLELLQDFQSVARALYASGSGRQGDVIRADVEVARMDAEIERIVAVRLAEAARLGALLGREGAAGFDRLEEAPSFPETPDPDELVRMAAAHRPALEAEAVRLQQARDAVRLAEREFWPDFTISAQYGRRGGSDPRSMGGVMVGASLPLHIGSRQRPRLEAARALERGAEAGVVGIRTAVEAEIRSAVADLERARTLIALYRDEILSAAEANVSSSLTSYRVGAVDFETLLDAQLSLDRFEQEYHQLVADHGSAFARLEAAVGRDLRSASNTTAGSAPEAP